MISFIENTWLHLVEGGNKEKIYRKYFKIFFILLLVILWANAAYRATRGHGSQYDDFTDFSRDLMVKKINLYETYSFDFTSIGKYPPFFGLVYAFLLPMPTALGAAVWFGLGVILIFFTARLLGKAIYTLHTGHFIQNVRQIHQAYWIAPLVLISVNAITNLETSQVNIFIFFLVAVGIYFFSQQKDIWAGIFLGIAIAVKITPAIFVAYLFYKRYWKVALVAAVTLVICWGPILLAILGIDFYVEVMQSWIAILMNYVDEGTMAEGMGGFRHTNQSLDAFFFRTFTHTEANGGFENFYLNLMSINYEWADKIVKGLKLGLALFLALLFFKPFKTRNHPSMGLELSIVAIAMLFISPISWINHYIAMILPLTVGVYWLRSRQLSAENHKQLKYIILFCGITLLLPQRIFQAFSLPFLGALALGIFFVKILLKDFFKKQKITSPA